MALEFPQLGKHCEFTGCQQLDFLPFQCACNKIFCLEHRNITAHKCTEIETAIIPQCPLCNQIIDIKKGEDPNRKVDEHINKGCPDEQHERTKSNQCTFGRCKNSEVIPILCNLCTKNFCVSHRLPQDHICEKLEVKTKPQSKREDKSNQVKERINNLVESQKSIKPTAKKVALMKMKMKAEGSSSIPPEKRFYLEVVFPMDSGVLPKQMYFNPAWTIGKVLDVIANVGDIENKNNSANAEKLHIISLRTGEPLNNSVTLISIGETLQSGDSVLLEKMEKIILDY